MIALGLVASACGASGETVSFGSQDTTCQSVELRNDDGDADLQSSAQDCFIEEFEAGRAVTVDLNIPTADGDPIFNRFAFDGETVLLVTDSRLDEFGSDGVRAERCRSVELAGRVITGVDCEQVSHGGFVEAN